LCLGAAVLEGELSGRPTEALDSRTKSGNHQKWRILYKWLTTS